VARASSVIAISFFIDSSFSKAVIGRQLSAFSAHSLTG